MRHSFILLIVSASLVSQAQPLTKLTVEKIMRDPKWIGASPSGIRWSHDSKTVYLTGIPNGQQKRLCFTSFLPAGMAQ
ncbi:hypothetical protein QQ054_15080 [Oscillatoria amoena NRMC-F 0135]|nr:hypothetical protein [Oscillatoria amoena NRMC-F 0135]